MTFNRYLVLALLLPMLGGSWLLLTGMPPQGSPQLEHIIIGYLIGTMFGQATLASAWCALGPLPLLWRLPMSLGWIAVLSIAFLVNMAIHSHGGDAEIAIILGGCMLGQWLLVQIPLWALSVGYGVRLRHWSDPAVTLRERQFGIRQLMILTAIVGVMLGAGRWLVGAAMSQLGGSSWGEGAIFLMLAAAGIVMTLPLLMASLLPRFAWLAVPGVLALIWLGTWYELPLVLSASGPGGGPNIYHLAFINAFQSAWVLAVVAVMRLWGYGIGQPVGESPFASEI